MIRFNSSFDIVNGRRVINLQSSENIKLSNQSPERSQIVNKRSQVKTKEMENKQDQRH